MHIVQGVLSGIGLLVTAACLIWACKEAVVRGLAAWRSRASHCHACGAAISFPWDYVTPYRVKWMWMPRLCRHCANDVVDAIHATIDHIKAQNR